MRAHGKLIAIAAHDDLMLPKPLELRPCAVSGRPQLDVFTSHRNSLSIIVCGLSPKLP